jgi:hypothetical protein
MAGPAPTYIALTPNRAKAAGGRTIQVVGRNFAAINTTMTIGGTAATNVVPVSQFLLDATVPAGTVGAADVVVTTPDGTATAVGALTYV